MAEQLPKTPDQFDRELDFSWIFKFMGVIAVTAIVMFVAMWYLSGYFDQRLADAQPDGSPLLERGQTTVPPKPHLQTEIATVRCPTSAIRWVEGQQFAELMVAESL